jgi:hypothetical protein
MHQKHPPANVAFSYFVWAFEIDAKHTLIKRLKTKTFINNVLMVISSSSFAAQTECRTVEPAQF